MPGSQRHEPGLLDDLWVLRRGNGDRFESAGACLFGNGVNDNCAAGNAVGRCVVCERKDVSEFVGNAAVDDAIKADRGGLVEIRNCDGIAEGVHYGCFVALNGTGERIEQKPSFLKESELNAGRYG